MNFTKVFPNIQNSIQNLFDKYKNITQMINQIEKKGGTAYLVGGAVRDIFLEKDVYDIDIEVHGLQLDQLSDLLSKFGYVNFVGKSFGVLKIEHLDIDWSLPRSDSAGRKPKVEINPDLTIEEALRRRDLTINAMAINLHNYELVDPFGGQEDIKNKVLRSPDLNFFTQDPLRFYRVMQFISRFQMYPDEELESICKTMEISKISIERIEYEFEKLLLKSIKPSLGLIWLKKISRLNEILPELYDTIDIKQNPEWHPEIYVFDHLMQTLDAATNLDYYDNNEKLTILYAALCHDLGKSNTTELIDGKLKSLGHAQSGVKLTKKMLKRITRKISLIDRVSILVKYHLIPFEFVDCNAKKAAYKRLALKLKKYNLNLLMLAKLGLADKRGRNGKSMDPLDIEIPQINIFIEKASGANVLLSFQEPLLFGRDLQGIVLPGPQMGKVLKYAYQIQLEKDITDKEILKQMVLKKLNIK